jgi:hypothetical protein
MCSLSPVLVVDPVIEGPIGTWWIDTLTSLGIVWFPANESRETWIGEKCC